MQEPEGLNVRVLYQSLLKNDGLGIQTTSTMHNLLHQQYLTINLSQIKAIPNWDFIPKPLDICIVCLDKQQNVLTQCNHGYCIECLLEWMNKNNKSPSCPMCRTKINTISYSLNSVYYKLRKSKNLALIAFNNKENNVITID